MNIILSLVGSGILAILIARYYHLRRSLKKNLVPFIQFQSDVVFVHENLRSDLTIEYRGEKIDNLQQVQFLIANTGEKAIERPINPLRLYVRNRNKILQSEILHIAPEGREVELNMNCDQCSVQFEFRLLNKGDFFVVKLLINGSPRKDDFEFSIEAADLPPKLEVQLLGTDQIGIVGKKKKLSITRLLTIVGAGIIYVIGLLGFFLEIILTDPNDYITKIFGSLILLISIVMGGQALKFELFGYSWPFRRKKFFLPQKVITPSEE